MGQSWGRAHAALGWELGKWSGFSESERCQVGFCGVLKAPVYPGEAAQVALSITAKWHQGFLCHPDVGTDPDLVTVSGWDFSLFF